MARVGLSRSCSSTKSDSPVEHPQPILGPDSQYDPKVLQVFIRRYISPVGTAAEWKNAPRGGGLTCAKPLFIGSSADGLEPVGAFQW